MTTVHKTFPPLLLAKYPHMFKGDIRIWEKFLKKFPKLYNFVQYDIKVGSGTKPIEGQTDAYRKMQEILSKYRIDAVGTRDDQTDIIEDKPQASTIAIGQTLAYVRLYVRDYEPTQSVIPTIITDYEVPDMRYLTRVLSVQYYVV